MSRIHSTALPALAFVVSAGLVGLAAPAQASSPAPAAPTAAVAQPAVAAAKPRVAAPKVVKIHEFERGKVTVSWTRVRGVTRYQMHAYKTDPKSRFIYPFNIVPGSEYWITTKRLSYSFVNNFTPHSDAKRLQALPWRITVAALSPNSSHRASSPKAPTLKIKDKTTVRYVKIPAHAKGTAKQKKSWKATVGKCAAQGLGAGLGTLGSHGLIALAATWIPGIGEVTWTAVAVEAGATSVTTALVCVALDRITGNMQVVSV
jgi:hypothetical protein